jgi:glycosyltransferase involved in cell wall biosynthesis
MSKKLIIHAPNINQGGGAVILQSLLDAAQTLSYEVLIQVDTRFKGSLNPNIKCVRVAPTLFGRLRAEWRLKKWTHAETVTLVLSNLPPLFGAAGKIHLFLQNRNLLDKASTAGCSPWPRLRITLERAWLRLRKRAVTQFSVQTESMQSLLKKILHLNSQVHPVYRSIATNTVKNDKKFDFIYVGTAEPHKNHARLLEAWCLLASWGFFPRLALTVPENATQLKHSILHFCNEYKLNITQLGMLSHEKVLESYGEACALIYPSLRESFGLPLLEAKQAGLPIIAGELDYVRDLVVPKETFDPYSALSIARAVARFLDVAYPQSELIDPKDFLAQITESKCAF